MKHDEEAAEADLEAVSDAHEAQAYLCVFSVTICEHIQRKLYTLQHFS